MAEEKQRPEKYMFASSALDKRGTRQCGFKLSSSRAPLLAPSPLRTGLEGFPFIRLEHSKTPPMNNEDAA